MLFLVLVFIGWSTQLIAGTSDSDLESGLMYLVSKDFGYTLLGDKPVSVEQGLSEYLQRNPEKKAALFGFLGSTFCKSEKFIFKVLNRHGYLELINKKALLRQIRKYKRLDSFVRKKFRSETTFLHALQNVNITIFEAVDYDPVLIAIVLGYGEENGEFFIRRADVGEYLQKYPIVSVFPFDQRPGPDWAFPRYSMYFSWPESVHKPTKSSQFTSLEQEWKWIKQNEWHLHDQASPKPPYYISLPVYVSRHGSESREIHKIYTRARNRLARLFCGKRVSEVVIEKALSK